MSGLVAHKLSDFKWHHGGADETDKSVTGGSDNEIREGLFMLDGKTS
jgi:hypothetical protein